MPSPLSSRSAVDPTTTNVSDPELPASAETPEPESHAAASRDSLTEWSPQAEQAYDHIDSANGWGLMPDSNAISSELNHLNEFDLKQVLNRLQTDGKLGEIISNLSPAQREGLVGQAMDSGLVKRDGGPNGNLKATADVAPTFNRMLDDFNAMGPGRTKPLNYKWDVEPTAVENLNNKVTSAVVDLKPGDSVALSGSSEADIADGKVTDALGLEVRNDAGKYVVSLNAAAGVGVAADEQIGRAETMGRAGARSEYTFPTADAAAAVTTQLLKDRGASAVGLGTPSAMELSGNLAGELAGKLGLQGLSTAQLTVGAKVDVSARLVLGKNPPQLQMKQSLTFEGSAAASFELMGHHQRAAGSAANGLKGERKLEVTTTFTLPNSSAADVAKDPLSAANRAMASAMTTVTVTSGERAEDLLHESETSAQVRPVEVTKFASNLQRLGAAAAFEKLGDKTKIEQVEKDYRISGGSLGGTIESHGFGVGASFGVERRSLLREHKSFEGTASELFDG